jgi:hypothetical protein
MASTTTVSKPTAIVVSSPMTSSKNFVRVNTEAMITMPIAVEVNSNHYVAASSPLSSPARKDSGLESGEVSDASDCHHVVTSAAAAEGASNNNDLYR